MYAMVDVIYGIPLNKNNGISIQRSDELEEAIEAEVLGMICPYSGADIEYSPTAFGISIGGFDEGEHHTEVSSIRMIPTENEINDFNVMFSALDPAVQGEIKETYGEPRVFFLWSTS